MPLSFTPSPRMSLGVEVELQILDAKTRDLAPAAPRVFERLSGEHPDIKPEIFQAMVEINTGICRTVREVRSALEKAVATLRAVGAGLGLELAAAGSHPFARYDEQSIYPSERFHSLLDRNRWIAQRLMIFGLHVHVGMRDARHAMATLNAMLSYLPHVLALSASSPFWQGRDTGLASSRNTVFETLPTAGHPCTFETWESFEAFYDAMIASKSITSVKDLWWDIRPHPDYGTVEVRICDTLPTISENVALVALIQSLFRWFDEQIQAGWRFQPPLYWILRENKWRASRDGLEAEILLDGSGRTALLRAEVERLLARLEGVASSLGCGEELRGIHTMLAGGGSYRRQRSVFERQGSLEAVTEALIQEFRSDRPAGQSP